MRENPPFQEETGGENAMVGPIHRKYFKIADVPIALESERPISEETFHPKFRLFETADPVSEGSEEITIRHRFSPFALSPAEYGSKRYDKSPWEIFENERGFVYRIVAPHAETASSLMAVTDRRHSHVSIHHPSEDLFRLKNHHSLTLMPTDQIVLAQGLAWKDCCFLHSGGVILDGKGFLFAGHSGAGKSTLMTMLRDRATILCDDRNIVRHRTNGFQVYGTWSHGDVAEVSASGAPLAGIFFLEQAPENRVIPMTDGLEIHRRILSVLIKPLTTAPWWEKMMALVGQLADTVPCYSLRFDRSGDIADRLERI